MTIRYAFPDDLVTLERLAALDSQVLPAGRLLLVEIAGELWAAVSIDPMPVVIADPFRPTAELVALLSGRARQLAMTEAPRCSTADAPRAERRVRRSHSQSTTGSSTQDRWTAS
ncbi:MAG: hypothetical protein ACR2NR_10910 [Solirubrobacteraceae bacterium]